MECYLKLCCELIEKVETKLKEEKNNNSDDKILELYEDLLMELYIFTEKNLDELI